MEAIRAENEWQMMKLVNYDIICPSLKWSMKNKIKNDVDAMLSR